MLRNTGNTESIIVEYGFLDSNEDDIEQLKNNWQKYAEAVVKGICNYIGVNYIPESSNIYIVQKGDSLWSIAKKYNTTVDNLKVINNLNSNLLSIGQKIITSEDNGNEYVVQKGDTLYAIAKKYNITVDKIIEENKLSSPNIYIGQKLLIPSSNSYIVKKGDSLWSISKKYNTTVDNLKKLNNLTSDILSIGQVLKI